MSVEHAQRKRVRDEVSPMSQDPSDVVKTAKMACKSQHGEGDETDTTSDQDYPSYRSLESDMQELAHRMDLVAEQVSCRVSLIHPASNEWQKVRVAPDLGVSWTVDVEERLGRHAKLAVLVRDLASASSEVFDSVGACMRDFAAFVGKHSDGRCLRVRSLINVLKHERIAPANGDEQDILFGIVDAAMAKSGLKNGALREVLFVRPFRRVTDAMCRFASILHEALGESVCLSSGRDLETCLRLYHSMLAFSDVHADDLSLRVAREWMPWKTGSRGGDHKQSAWKRLGDFAQLPKGLGTWWSTGHIAAALGDHPVGLGQKVLDHMLTFSGRPLEKFDSANSGPCLLRRSFYTLYAPVWRIAALSSPSCTQEVRCRRQQPGIKSCACGCHGDVYLDKIVQSTVVVLSAMAMGVDLAPQMNAIATVLNDEMHTSDSPLVALAVLAGTSAAVNAEYVTHEQVTTWSWPKALIRVVLLSRSTYPRMDDQERRVGWEDVLSAPSVRTLSASECLLLRSQMPALEDLVPDTSDVTTHGQAYLSISTRQQALQFLPALVEDS
ncbi:hypothetical protein ml_68 [Mollivirus sibericum]|uniref:hypothetical protein n=1 Tax=Mollivirus sibericum TaxID=1678078 RepID=UPI0006B2EE4B|nr:hypothetical protein ml_68 [Mollivirus sibericum]ALD61870.1 hypothetical protein ml_68 [Mollivirus sibericum]